MQSAHNQTIARISPVLGEVAVRALSDYLETLGDQEPRNIHRMIVDAVEVPVFAHLLHINGGNQSKTAEQLSMNRATLRTKLKRHNLI